MTWRGPRTTRDRLLTTPEWRAIRKHWIRLALPCARCGGRIDYEGPYYLPTLTGRRRLNPRYLHVGHIVSRAKAKRMGWTEQQINALSNTQPEHSLCSRLSGARDGQRVQAQRRQQTLTTSRRW